MKCQKCGKLATYHITDIEQGKPREFHFCDEHARQHLASPAGHEESESLAMSKLNDPEGRPAPQTSIRRRQFGA